MIQKTLVKIKANKSYPITIYYANVKEIINKSVKDIKDNKIIKEEKITSTTQQEELDEVVYSLSKGSGGEFYLDELNRMDQEVRYWIESLIGECPSTDYEKIIYLLVSFCKEFKTRQREVDKYVLLVLSQNHLLLAHSKGEKGLVGIKDALKIAELLLAFGNVTRYVEFSSENNSKILCKYHEFSKSGFFIRFLGISPSEQIYYLSDITIFAEFHGLESAFHFSRKEFEKKFILDTSEYSIKNNQLVFSNRDPLAIKYIRMGRKQYKDSEGFRQDFMMAYYDLDYYNNYYKSLYFSENEKGTLRLHSLPTLYPYIDEKEALIKIEKDKKVPVIPKVSGMFTILFVDENIGGDSSFLRELKQKYCYQEKVKIYHSSSKFVLTPIIIGPYEIYNDTGIDNKLLEVVEQSNKLIKDSGSAFIKNSLYHYLFGYLYAVTNHQIKWVFKRLSESFLEDVQTENIVVSSDEDDIIEFKRREWLSGDSGKARELAEKVSGDVLTKIKDSNGNFKIYYIGFDQDTKQPDLFWLKEWDTERVGRLKEEIETNLSQKLILKDFYFTQVPLDKKCFFIMIIKGELNANPN